MRNPDMGIANLPFCCYTIFYVNLPISGQEKIQLLFLLGTPSPPIYHGKHHLAIPSAHTYLLSGTFQNTLSPSKAVFKAI